jgi:signal transduction histidine kinase
MNLRAIFENRSGRVIAVLRFVFATVFLVSLAIEKVTAGETIRAGLILLGGYVTLSLLVIPIAWRSWWLDHRLAMPLLVVDIAVFITAVFVTEVGDADFTSPFIALFALIMLSCTLRWGWMMAARTGAVVAIVFMIVGLSLIALDYPVAVTRFARRAFYMVALFPVLAWFGMDRRGAQVPPLLGLDEAETLDAVSATVLDYAMRVCGAGHGILAWSDRDEPWVVFHEVAADGTVRHTRGGPAEQPDWNALGGSPWLFDLRHARALIGGGDGRVEAINPANPIPLAVSAGISSGLALPLACSAREGLIVLGGIDGPGPDFLALGTAVIRELRATGDRVTAHQLEREKAVTRTRSAIARDLHDSVAQSLAGACFRLEALRRGLADRPGQAADADPAQEIAAVRDALRSEQAHVRGLIGKLREPAGLPEPHPLDLDLERTLAEAAAHWNIVASFVADGAVPTLSGLGHELRQLLREAVANAVRHGAASEVRVALCRGEGSLQLLVADNGSGFADGSGAPWSISERVAVLGGELEVHSGKGGTRLIIFLPLAALPQS